MKGFLRYEKMKILAVSFTILYPSPKECNAWTFHCRIIDLLAYHRRLYECKCIIRHLHMYICMPIAYFQSSVKQCFYRLCFDLGWWPLTKGLWPRGCLRWNGLMSMTKCLINLRYYLEHYQKNPAALDLIACTLILTNVNSFVGTLKVRKTWEALELTFPEKNCPKQTKSPWKGREEKTQEVWK